MNHREFGNRNSEEGNYLVFFINIGIAGGIVEAEGEEPVGGDDECGRGDGDLDLPP